MKIKLVATIPNSKAVETKQYPDTAKGAFDYLSDVGTFDLKDCEVHADPEVKGVWAADLRDGETRVIVYLCGYPNPMGEIRQYNDFEEM